MTDEASDELLCDVIGATLGAYKATELNGYDERKNSVKKAPVRLF